MLFRVPPTEIALLRPFSSLICAATLALTGCPSRSPCPTLDTLLDQTYGFKPSAMSAEERTAKSDAMDDVWEAVGKQKGELLPCLRAAIASRTTDPFFQLDASALLISLDSSPQSKQLQVSVLANVDLRDVNPRDWLTVATHRAVEGFNTVSAALHWLEFPDSVARYYLPEHGAYEVGRTRGALFLFGSLAESLATPALVAIARDLQHRDRATAIWLLMQQATDAARDALASVPVSELPADAQQAVSAYLRGPRARPLTDGPPRITRDEFVNALKALRTGNAGQFFALVVRVPDGETDAAKVLTADDLADVRFARRFFVAAATPEAVGYYTAFTGIIESVSARSGRP